MKYPSIIVVVKYRFKWIEDSFCRRRGKSYCFLPKSVLGAEEIIDERGCELVILRVNRCSGQCLSFSFPNPITGRTSVHAKCCRMTDSEWVTTELMCNDGPRPIKIPSAVQCDCFDCAIH
ncbi:unnamed protein product [Angiostrongylus costaricensis]|uniref:CTCK domain-containing protein n=1 Tax=Angiostrongylus costaricensis TaxID=334426 RepID=A0A3P7HWG2_ANGCS|nr:unnamed protein product [Angiostrongylus costaricensis]